MDISYQDRQQAENFSKFLESKDGQFQRKLVLKEVLVSLKNGPFPATILDLGCGSGWLSFELFSKGHNLKGCDAGAAQIELAKKLYPQIEFLIADPQTKLPFADNTFDAIVASLVLCDIKNQPAALKEILRVLKPDGKLINIIPNPYYTMPVIKWKRGFWAKIFHRNPKPVLSQYFSFLDRPREFKWRGNITRRFYTLAEQINNIILSGFILTSYREPRAEAHTNKFSRQHQVYLFPIYLVIEAKKPSPA